MLGTVVVSALVVVVVVVVVVVGLVVGAVVRVVEPCPREPLERGPAAGTTAGAREPESLDGAAAGALVVDGDVEETVETVAGEDMALSA